MTKSLITSVLAVALCACSTVPRSAVDVNDKVTEGVEALRDNGLQMVGAWEDMAYFVLG